MTSNRTISTSEEPVPRPVVRRKLIDGQFVAQQQQQQQINSNETSENERFQQLQPSSSEVMSEETSMRSSTDEEVRKITKRMEQQQMKTDA
ncbi:hypothetical protein BLA29_013528, partial [Euroglyphus maynei]